MALAVLAVGSLTFAGEMQVAQGKVAVLDDFVREGHALTVYYSEENGTRYARRLRVR